LVELVSRFAALDPLPVGLRIGPLMPASTGSCTFVETFRTAGRLAATRYATPPTRVYTRETRQKEAPLSPPTALEGCLNWYKKRATRYDANTVVLTEDRMAEYYLCESPEV